MFAQLRRALGIGLIACSLPGCIAVPFSSEPGFVESKRALGDGIPSYIVIGKTTRAEVLEGLGTAEVEAPDESWFYYESDYIKDESGAWGIVGGPGAGAPFKQVLSRTWLHRRLLVRFSSDNVVASADFYAQECGEPDAFFLFVKDRRFPQASHLRSCEILEQGVRWREQRENDRLSHALHKGERPAVQFDFALWTSPTSRELLHCEQLYMRDRSRSLEQYRGVLAISSEALIFLPKAGVYSGATPDPVRISLADIAAVSENHTSYMSGARIFSGASAVDVKRRDGSDFSFTICKHYAGWPPRMPSWDSQQITAARTLLESQLSQSAKQEP